MLSGRCISALGLLVIVAGFALPLLSLYQRTQAHAIGVQIADGPLRPEMIRLPNSHLFVAEYPVTEGNLYRVLHQMPPDVARAERSEWSNCPAPFGPQTLDMPVTCVTRAYVIAYANRLTEIENAVRARVDQALLTLCYRASSTARTEPGCTGYRLATVSEWAFAAGIDPNLAPPLACATQDSSCMQMYIPKHVKQHQHSRWYLYDLDGNVDEMAAADGAIGDLVVLRASMRTEGQPVPGRAVFVAPSIVTGFRIVRQEPP
jgi:hypothetical protein